MLDMMDVASGRLALIGVPSVARLLVVDELFIFVQKTLLELVIGLRVLSTRALRSSTRIVL